MLFYLRYKFTTKTLCEIAPFFLGLLPEFDGVDKTNPNCVIIGDAAEHFSYQNLNEAFRVLIGLEKPVLFSLGQGYSFPPPKKKQNSFKNKQELELNKTLLINLFFFLGGIIRRRMGWN